MIGNNSTLVEKAMMHKRDVSTRTRFEVFKRDKFACQYCGSHPPEVILHVDHIVALANGGDNEIDNLITACQHCNLGKSTIPLNQVPKSLADKAAEIAEAEAQIKGYNEIIQSQRYRIESEAWNIVELWQGDLYNGECATEYLVSIKNFISKLGYHEVYNSMEKAITKLSSSPFHYQFKYFCGICWNKIREGENG